MEVNLVLILKKTMINIGQTIEEFGYSPVNLALGSHKKIVVTCDYCGNNYKPTRKNLTISQQNGEKYGISKDACKPCGQSKARDICEAKGVSWADKTKEKREALRKSLIEKYGVDHYSKTKEFSRQMIEASSKKTQEEWDEIERKKRETRLEKYGVEHVFQSPEIKEKVKKTMLERHGAENPSNIPEFQEKRRETMKERFGVEYAGQNEEIKAKIAETNKEKYGGLFMNIPELKNEFTKRGIQKKVDNGKAMRINGKSVMEIAKEKDIAPLEVYRMIRMGIDPEKFKKRGTIIEEYIREVLESIGARYKFNKHISPEYRYDFLINDSNLIIECDGLYWHSELFKERDYHYNKRSFYDSINMKSLFFYENEIINKFSIVSSIISKELKKTDIIPVEKCTIKKEPKGKSFIYENHLEGTGSGDTYLLNYNNTPVYGIQINETSSKVYEIIKFCAAINTSLDESRALSILIDYVISKLDIRILKIKVNRRYCNINILKLGFRLDSEHTDFLWTDGTSVYPSIKFNNNDGYKNNLTKIWDCGQAKYIKEF